MRNLKTLVASLMDDSERFLVKYQSVNAIELFSSSESSGGEEQAYKRIPKLLAGRVSKQNHEQTIDEFMAKYLQEKLTAKDYKLLNCVCTKKELTNEKLGLLNMLKNAHKSKAFKKTAKEKFGKLKGMRTEEAKNYLVSNLFMKPVEEEALRVHKSEEVDENFNSQDDDMLPEIKTRGFSKVVISMTNTPDKP